MSQEFNKFKDECFEYNLLNLNPRLSGWELKSIPGVKEFKCKSEINGYPVISLNGTFKDYKYDTIDLSGMDTSNVICMEFTFENCAAKDIDLSSFDFIHTDSMEGMFSYCLAKKITFGKDKIAHRLRYASEMFYKCSRLVELDMGGLEILDINSMNRIFIGCVNLRYLDARRFYKQIYLIEYKDRFINYLDNIRCIIVPSDEHTKKVLKDKDLEFDVIECKEKDIEKIKQKANLLSTKSLLILVTDSLKPWQMERINRIARGEIG